MQPRTAATDNLLSFGLAFVGGYGDAAGFVLAKTFTGHITGSMVLAAIAVAAHDWAKSFAHLTAIVSFLAGIVFSVLLARPLAARSSWPLLPTALAIEMMLIAGGYFALLSHVSPRVEIFVVCMSLALGLQNGAFRRTGGISVHTNYLTGTITGLLTTAAERYVSHENPPFAIPPDPKVALHSGIWVAFVLGALTGAAMVFRFKELGILGAALVLSAIIARDRTLVSRTRLKTGT